MNPLKNNRILVVDNKEILFQVLSGLITRDGYTVKTTSSAEEAWEMFSDEPFPLVIMDLVMNCISGIDLLQKIKQRHPATQVIIMTGDASLDSATASFRAGAFDYLSKPFQGFEKIRASVNLAMKKYAQIHQNLSEIDRLKKRITEVESANKVLKNMSIRDGLTGLFNYRYFQEDLACELLRSNRYKRTFSLLFIKIESFESFIETYGKTEADKLLITVGHQLNLNLRKTDLLARYKDEMFLAILPETSKSNSKRLADSLCMRVANNTREQSGTRSIYNVALSIGVSTYPADGKDGSTLLKLAQQTSSQTIGGALNRVNIKMP
jgi:diguanylate cyclase (GGDEF)-like protein